MLPRDPASLQEFRKSHRHQGPGKLSSCPRNNGLMDCMRVLVPGIHLWTVLGQRHWSQEGGLRRLKPRAMSTGSRRRRGKERSSRKALQGGDALRKQVRRLRARTGNLEKDRNATQCKQQPASPEHCPPHPTSPGLATTALRKSRPVRVSGTGDERWRPSASSCLPRTQPRTTRRGSAQGEVKHTEHPSALLMLVWAVTVHLC